MADETKRVDVIVGPYRNTLLTMPAAEADAAIAAHWARDVGAPYGDHDPLTDEERQAALASATAWAQAQWDAAQQEGMPAEQRAFNPKEESSGYRTRMK